VDFRRPFPSFPFRRKSVSGLKSSSFPGLISIQNLPKSVLFPDISEFFGDIRLRLKISLIFGSKFRIPQHSLDLVLGVKKRCRCLRVSMANFRLQLPFFGR
jgi:hypothetical protein